MVASGVAYPAKAHDALERVAVHRRFWLNPLLFLHRPPAVQVAAGFVPQTAHFIGLLAQHSHLVAQSQQLRLLIVRQQPGVPGLCRQAGQPLIFRLEPGQFVNLRLQGADSAQEFRLVLMLNHQWGNHAGGKHNAEGKFKFG